MGPEVSTSSPRSNAARLTRGPRSASAKAMPCTMPRPRIDTESSSATSAVSSSCSLSPLRRTSSLNVLSCQYFCNVAVAVTKAGLLPRNVPLCSPGVHWSRSGLMSVRAMGRPYPLMDFDNVTISGLIPASSNEKNEPVRPQPIWTSSTIRMISRLRHRSASACSHSARATFTPPSPCTVSTMTAAGLLRPPPSSSTTFSNH
ncbi:Uncharacterised protein [Mycobacteroides abscessus subsp. abscessus]|nr:Uncharacterised protein [Mycobacteroides abscessus subsp. abscessus]